MVIAVFALFVGCKKEGGEKTFNLKGSYLEFKVWGNDFRIDMLKAEKEPDCIRSKENSFFCHDSVLLNPIRDSLQNYFNRQWVDNLDLNSVFNKGYNLASDTSYINIGYDVKLKHLLLLYKWNNRVFKKTIVKSGNVEYKFLDGQGWSVCGVPSYVYDNVITPIFIIQEGVSVKKCISKGSFFKKAKIKCLSKTGDKQFKWFLTGRYEYQNLKMILNSKPKSEFITKNEWKRDSINNLKPKSQVELDSINDEVWKTLDSVPYSNFNKEKSLLRPHIYVDTNMLAIEFLKKIEELLNDYPELNSSMGAINYSPLLFPIKQ